MAKRQELLVPVSLPEDTIVAQSKPKTAKYLKKQLIQSSRYEDRKDLLAVILDDDEEYTRSQVDKRIDRFMKGKVK